jgi:two-component system, NtrC family, nitrogen regulation sensor histidine kinase NtrY
MAELKRKYAKIYKSGMLLGLIGFVLCVLAFLMSRPLSNEHREASVQGYIKGEIAARYTLVDDLLTALKANPDNPQTIREIAKIPGDQAGVFVYEAGMLRYWSSNLIPEPFPYPGDPGQWFTLRMANGWYAGKAEVFQQYTMVVMARIYADYRYDNSYLTDGFTDLSDVQATILSADQANGDDLVISDPDGRPVMAIRRLKQTRQTELKAIWLSTLFIGGVFMILLGLWQWMQRISKLPKWVGFGLFTLVLVAVRLLLFEPTIRRSWADNDLFDPILYASSSVFPSLGDFLLNAVFLLMFSLSLHQISKEIKSHWRPKTWFSYPIAILLMVTVLLIALWIAVLCKSLVIDGKLNLDVTNILQLNIFSYLAFISIGVVFSAFVFYTIPVFRLLAYWIPSNRNRIFMFALCGIWFGLLLTRFMSWPWIIYVWPLFLGLVLILNSQASDRWSFGRVFNLLVLFAVGITAVITHFEGVKEQESRVLLAEKLAETEDPLIEFRFAEVTPDLQDDAVLQGFILGQIESKEDVIIHLENIYFRDIWDKYEMEYYVYRGDSAAVNFDPYALSKDLREFGKYMRQHGRQSENSPYMFTVGDYFNKLAYLIALPIGIDSTLGHLVVEMRSKKLPDDIGFPELLIDRNTKSVQELARYAVARYSNNKLVTRLGDYEYPVDASYFASWISEADEQGYIFFEDGNHNHLLWIGDQGSLMLISYSRSTLLASATTFSYLLLLAGLFIGVIALLNNALVNPRSFRLSLNAKIRAMILGILLITLFLFGLGTRFIILQEYTDKNNRLISEKLLSVHEELRKKIGREVEIDPGMRNYLNFVLKRFSEIFFTDIILYDIEGRVLASSRNEVFYSGLLSELMHPRAYARLHVEDKVEFIQEEMIGTLNYLCAYTPLLNNDGKVLGYIALPYFAKQNPLESEISSLLVTLINIFVLLLALGVVAALFVTSWVTKPLKSLQESLASIQLGKLNRQLDYKGSDEIGSLVKVYNQKVEELEMAAEALARSERESAWREMARQVAHEIKNPLTPMKLSVQHFQRTFNKDDEESQERLNRFSKMLIEQIDTLTNIANEFSNFAKMPKSRAQDVAVMDVVSSVVQLFGDSSKAVINYEHDEEDLFVYIDKDELTRVLTNLVKNAVQALPNEANGEITVTVRRQDNKVLISVADNGSGISDEARGKIFQPNFTTKSSGTGLGLAMVRSIVEQADGHIWFEDNPGGGTLFFVELPSSSFK